MEYRLASTREIRWDALQFPFPLRWQIDRGIHRLSPLIGTVRTGRDGAICLRAEQPFSVVMVPDVGGAASGRLVLEGPVRSTDKAPDWHALGNAFWRSSGGFGLVLAQNMFFLHDYSWSLGDAAQCLGTKPRCIQMTLFRECYSFASTLRRCRRLNRLLARTASGTVAAIHEHRAIVLS